MKIAIVVHDLKGGGAEKMMVRLANGLASIGEDVTLVLLTQGGVNMQYVSQSVVLVELKSKRTALAAFNLREYFKKESPDKILAALTHVNVVAILACLSLGISQNLFVSERNAFSLDKLISSEKLIKIAYFIAPFFYRMIKNPVIAVSKGVAQDLVDTTIVNQASVTNAPNPVLDNDFMDREYKAPTHPWLLDKKIPTIVAVGRLAPQKGFDILITAIKSVTREIDCRLVIFGEGDLKNELEEQIHQLGLSDRVNLAGYVSEPLNEMAAADLFVLSSRFEGSPNVLVEAMSTGVKVLATDCPHGPDEILKSGSIGYIAKTQSSKALAKTIIEALNSKTYDKTAQLNQAATYTIHASALAYRNILFNGGL
ncbi:MAG: glycosyltransferase [Oceanospirillaceae bacterium]